MQLASDSWHPGTRAAPQPAGRSNGAFAHPAPHRCAASGSVMTDLATADFTATYAMDTDPLVMRHIGTGEPETRPFDSTVRSSRNVWASGSVNGSHGRCACMAAAMNFSAG